MTGKKFPPREIFVQYLLEFYRRSLSGEHTVILLETRDETLGTQQLRFAM
jgi:hypothetical protein